MRNKQAGNSHKQENGVGIIHGEQPGSSLQKNLWNILRYLLEKVTRKEKQTNKQRKTHRKKGMRGIAYIFTEEMLLIYTV